MRAELLRQLGAVVAPVDRNDLKAHAARVLHAEVTQSADAEHRDEVASARRRVAQRAERGESGAQQGRSGNGREILWHGHQTARFRDHHLRVAAIMLYAGESLVCAVHEIAVAAVFAIPAIAAEKADADALADVPAFDAGADDIRPLRGQALADTGLARAHPLL